MQRSEEQPRNLEQQRRGRVRIRRVRRDAVERVSVEPVQRKEVQITLARDEH